MAVKDDMADKAERGAFRLDRMHVGRGRMSLSLSWDEDVRISTSPNLVRATKLRYPTITAHSCINSMGPTFGHVISRTSIPHLIEHIAIEEQIERSPEDSDPSAMFVGTTEVDRPSNSAVIEISFSDDLIAARSVAAALEFVNANL